MLARLTPRVSWKKLVPAMHVHNMLIVDRYIVENRYNSAALHRALFYAATNNLLDLTRHFQKYVVPSNELIRKIINVRYGELILEALLENRPGIDWDYHSDPPEENLKVLLKFSTQAQINIVISYEVARERSRRVKICLNAGADPNYDHLGCKLLCWAIHNAEIAKLLLDAGAQSCEQSADDTRNPFFYAIKANAIVTFNLILDRKIDVNFRNEIGESALHIAVFNGRACMVLELLRLGANPNAVNNIGFTPLFVVKDIEIVSILLKHGANINHQDNKGFTPLMQAIRKEEWEVFLYLLEMGADTTIANHEGRTAARIATKEAYAERIKEAHPINILNDFFHRRQIFMQTKFVDQCDIMVMTSLPTVANLKKLISNSLFLLAIFESELFYVNHEEKGYFKLEVKPDVVDIIKKEFNVADRRTLTTNEFLRLKSLVSIPIINKQQRQKDYFISSQLEFYIKDLEFFQDFLHCFPNTELLSQVMFQFACVLACLENNEAARFYFKAAAEREHPRAKQIVESSYNSRKKHV